jgi:hypothetical protein
MPLLAENPNLAVTPNFQSEEYAEAQAQLTNEAINDNQAIEILANLWRIQNEADKCHWDARVEAEAHEAEALRREAAQEEEQCQLALKADQEAAIQEERKKNKAKYTPVKDLDVPSDPIILPCQYAVRKMKSGEYCELSYFTNNGLEEASRSTFMANEDALVMMPTADGLNKWIPASAAVTTQQANKRDGQRLGLKNLMSRPNKRINAMVRD